MDASEEDDDAHGAKFLAAEGYDDNRSVVEHEAEDLLQYVSVFHGSWPPWLRNDQVKPYSMSMLDMAFSKAISGFDQDFCKGYTYGRTPMARAAERGDLRVAKWLYKNGAAEDITKPGTRRFKDSGELDREDETPVLLSCKGGHVSVCQWLCEVGAADDISKADDDGMSPFLWACQRKHLSVCQWLVQEGADDITKANNKGETPLFLSCENGDLPTCEWLIESGAISDITKAPGTDDDPGDTPLYVAQKLAISQLLILNGALNSAVTGHVDAAIVDRDIKDQYKAKYRCQLLRDWAHQVITVHDTFMIMLRASVVHSSRSRRRISPRRRCHLPKLTRDVKQLIAEFCGVEKLRRMRNVREFAEIIA